MSLFTTCGWVLRLGVTLALLVSIHPALALLARVRAADGARPRPGGPASSARPRSAAPPAQPAGAPPLRHRHHRAARQGGARHAASASASCAQRRAAWERWYGPVAAARRGSAVWHALGWAIFGAAYVGAVVFVSSAPRGDARATCCWCWRRARGSRRTSARRSARSASCAASGSTARGAWPGSRTTPRRCVQDADAPVPERLERGHPLRARLVRVPGHASASCSTTWTCDLAPGSVVAIVGENGAGKTHAGEAAVPACTSRRAAASWSTASSSRACSPEGWRARLAGAFQDFFRFEFRARHSVGVGDVPRLDDAPAVAAAVERAGASDVVAQLAAGLETQLGPTWPEGVDLSFGQWQKLALARGFMRERPLLLVLDEPTAALDAETEHALFERYAAARARRPDHAARLAPLQHRAHGRLHRRARRRARRRDRHARGADGEARPVRRALRHPGRGLSLRRRRSHGEGSRSDPGPVLRGPRRCARLAREGLRLRAAHELHGRRGAHRLRRGGARRGRRRRAPGARPLAARPEPARGRRPEHRAPSAGRARRRRALARGRRRPARAWSSRSRTSSTACAATRPRTARAIAGASSRGSRGQRRTRRAGGAREEVAREPARLRQHARRGRAGRGVRALHRRDRRMVGGRRRERRALSRLAALRARRRRPAAQVRRRPGLRDRTRALLAAARALRVRVPRRRRRRRSLHRGGGALRRGAGRHARHARASGLGKAAGRSSRRAAASRARRCYASGGVAGASGSTRRRRWSRGAAR